jgi:hypothetical protein
MVGSDMTPSLPLKQSLSGAVYSVSSTSSWSNLGSVARDSTRTYENGAQLSNNSKYKPLFRRPKRAQTTYNQQDFEITKL